MADGNDPILPAESRRFRFSKDKRWFVVIGLFLVIILISKACAPTHSARPNVQDSNPADLSGITKLSDDINKNLTGKNQPSPTVTPPQKNLVDDPEYQDYLRHKDDQLRAEREAKAEEERKLREEALHSISVISPQQQTAPGGTSTPETATAPHPTPTPQESEPQIKPAADNEASPFASRDKWDGPLHYLVRGTLIPCTLQNQINGSAAGPLKCQVSRDIYSQNSEHILIPRGSFLNGEVGKVGSVNQERLYASFNDILMPDLFEYTMKDQVALSQEGQVGLKEKVDHHTWQIFGTALALAGIGGLAEVGNTRAYTSALGEYRIGVTSNISESSMQILQQRLSISPSFTVQPGARNALILDKTIQLPEWEKHRMGTDL